MKTTILLAGSLLFATASFAQSDSAMDIAELQAAIQGLTPSKNHLFTSTVPYS
jgi:hypothetical protein